jgi:WD40 repeat protein
MTGVTLRSAVFDEASGEITVATTSGFSIFDCYTSTRVADCRLPDTLFPQGLRFVATLGKSNILAITPYSTSNEHVYLWDRAKNEQIARVSFGGPVLGVRLHPDILIASTSNRISVRQLSDFSEIASYESAPMRDGTFDVPELYSSSLIAFPASGTGVISVADYLDPTITPLHIQAHRAPITFVRFNASGRLLAVAGDEGRDITVFSVPSMQPVRLFRRSESPLAIVSMAFEPRGSQLAVTSGVRNLLVFAVAWPDFEQRNEPDARPPGQPIIRLKDGDNNIVWAWFADKAMKLGGLAANGNYCRVVGDDPAKAGVEVEGKLAFGDKK